MASCALPQSYLLCPGGFSLYLGYWSRFQLHPHQPLKRHSPNQSRTHKWPHSTCPASHSPAPPSLQPRGWTREGHYLQMLSSLAPSTPPPEFSAAAVDRADTSYLCNCVFLLCLGAFSGMGSLVGAMGVTVEGGLPPQVQPSTS